MKNTQKITKVIASTRNAAKQVASKGKEAIKKVRLTRPIPNPRVIGYKFLNFLTLFTTFLEFISVMKFFRSIKKFLKAIMGPYFKIVVPTIITLIIIFRDILKYIMLVNLIYAIFLAICNLLSQDFEFTLQFFIYMFYSFFYQIVNYFCDMLNNFLIILRKLLNRLSEDFYQANSYLEYKSNLNINNTSPFETNKSDYLFSSSTNYNDYDNTNSLNYKNSDMETEIDVKKVLIALGITVLLAGVYVYIQDPSYYNESIYNGYKATIDYISSFFWDRPDRPDKPNLPPLDKGKGIDLGESTSNINPESSQKIVNKTLTTLKDGKQSFITFSGPEAHVDSTMSRFFRKGDAFTNKDSLVQINYATPDSPPMSGGEIAQDALGRNLNITLHQYEQQTGTRLPTDLSDITNTPTNSADNTPTQSTVLGRAKSSTSIPQGVDIVEGMNQRMSDLNNSRK